MNIVLDIIRVALIEDDPTIQESIQAFLKTQGHMEEQSVNTSIEAFLEAIPRMGDKPDILLLDINLPGMSGLEGIVHLLKALPELDIIMLTTFEDTDSIFQALSNGACSYISKQTSLKKIGEAIEVVAQGGSYMSPAIARKIANHFAPKANPFAKLTDRQMEIVDLIVVGKSYKMIAADLFVSLDTVRHHIKNIYRTLNINSNTELVRKALGR